MTTNRLLYIRQNIEKIRMCGILVAVIDKYKHMHENYIIYVEAKYQFPWTKFTNVVMPLQQSIYVCHVFPLNDINNIYKIHI